MDYDIIIGLEIHAELKTKSKMFCSCDNDSNGVEPNKNACPICLGHPGTLPVPNKSAIEWTILVGQALHCAVNRQSKFDRKNYFYPDLPKGYQISQYDLPLVYGGYLDIDGVKVAITRIHLEEDTAKSTHPSGKDYTLVDCNRAGTPLIEMVTEPVIRSAEAAKKFCQRYQQVLRYLDVSNADMEKGEMRCEANVSIQVPGTWEYVEGTGVIKPVGDAKLNPKVELKNINSFRAIEKAVQYELKRQQDALSSGEPLVQETRGWDENRAVTVRQRVKETSADYRYFPEPDIPPLDFDDTWLATIKAKLKEMPSEKKARFIAEYDLSPDTAEILVADEALANWTENVISELRAWIESTGDDWGRQKRKLSAAAGNWITSELFKHLSADKKTIHDLAITPENFAEFITLVYQDKINSSAAQTILEHLYRHGGDPTAVMAQLGLEQIDDSAALQAVIDDIISANPDQIAQYRAGKTAVLQFLIGQAMASTKGKANPKMVSDLLVKQLQ